MQHWLQKKNPKIYLDSTHTLTFTISQHITTFKLYTVRMPDQTFFLFMHVKRSNFCPGLPAPCLHNRTVAVTPWPAVIKKQQVVKPDSHLPLHQPATLTACIVKHSLWGSCGRPVAAEVGRESSEWVPRASYRQTSHWPYPSPTLHPPYSSRSPSNHTGSCRANGEKRDYLYSRNVGGPNREIFD